MNYTPATQTPDPENCSPEGLAMFHRGMAQMYSDRATRSRNAAIVYGPRAEHHAMLARIQRNTK